MLTEKRMVGESLIFNNKIRTCITHIEGKEVTFKTTLQNGKHETCNGLLNQFVTLAGKIKVKITDISERVVTLKIISPVNMVISRLNNKANSGDRDKQAANNKSQFNELTICNPISA